MSGQGLVDSGHQASNEAEDVFDGSDRRPALRVSIYRGTTNNERMNSYKNE